MLREDYFMRMSQLSLESPQKIRHDISSTEVKKHKAKDEKLLFLLIFKDILKQYQETASIHGVSRTSQPQLYTCRRLIWAVLVGIMAVMLATTLNNLITELYSHPIKTVTKISQHDELAFPAVTICSLNQFIIDRVPDNPMIRHVLFYKSEYAGIKGYGDILKDLSNLTDVPGEELFHVTQNAAPRLDELILTCSWKSQSVKCEDIFHPVQTTYGKCYIFNADKRNARVSKMSGFREGLKVRMNINNEKSFFSHYMEAGVFLLINDQNSILVPQLDGYTLRPGVSANIKLRRTDNIHLPYPYKAFSNRYCENTEAESYSNKLYSFASYSKTACIIECYVNHSIKNCGCKGFNEIGNARICSGKEYVSCYVPTIIRFKQAELMACGCMDQCKTISYEVEVFYADYSSSFIQETARTDDLKYLSQHQTNFIEATIFYKSLNVQTYEQQPAISMDDVIGTLGGQMGLFLGVSLLSFAEIVEAIFLLIYNYIRASKTRSSCKVENQAEVTGESKFPPTSFVAAVNSNTSQLFDPLHGVPSENNK